MIYLWLIPLAWIGISHLLARLSGWSRLTKRFRCEQFQADETGRFRSVVFGAIQYHSSVNLSINAEGLRMAVILPFRLGHPPLFIRWTQMHRIEAENKLYSHRVRVSIGSPTIACVVLPGWVRYRMPTEIRPASDWQKY